jgi:hypothetical protein
LAFLDVNANNGGKSESYPTLFFHTMTKSHIHRLLALLTTFALAKAFTSFTGSPVPRSLHITKTSPSIDNDTSSLSSNNSPCSTLLLDHININHQKGQHDALNAFYFDFLKCSIDPRKYENYQLGSGTIWANVGMHQFHLPEGKPHAQVLDGVITLVHENLDGLMERYAEFIDGDDKFAALQGTEFHMDVERDDDNLEDVMLFVTDPWGTQFCIMGSDDTNEDRAEFEGAQPSLDGAEKSEGLKVEDVTLYVRHGSNLQGIARFYQHVFGATSVEELESEDSISIAVGERQTLSFQYHPDGPKVKVRHEELRFEVVDDKGNPSNLGPHISMYVTNLPHAYQMAEELNVLYVNARFKRRAYSQEEAIDQCMFRVLDVVDPLDKEKKVIVSLEHEVRAVKTRDGKKYKSCPLSNVDL